jgi:hypothetical protein
MSLSLIRPNKLYGKDGRIPVGKTKFYRDIVQRSDAAEYVPGTKVRRLRLAELGPKVTVAFEDEVDALVEGLRRERDEKLRSPIEQTARRDEREQAPAAVK